MVRNLFIYLLHFREKTEEFGIDPVGYRLEILRTVLELDVIHVDDEEMTVIFLDPVFVTLVQAGNRS